MKFYDTLIKKQKGEFMKKLFILLLSIMLLFSFTACSSNDNSSNNRDVKYAIDFGIKIEEIKKNKQDEISSYVEDCKILYINGYKERLGMAESNFESKAYFVFTETLMYDFSTVNEGNLSEDSLSAWKYIKDLGCGDSKPIYYIEFFGLCPFYGIDMIPKTLNSVGVQNGFFIYEDKTVVQCSYNNLLVRGFVDIVTGTTKINCGNNYAETISTKDLATYNKQLKILTKI